MKDDDLHPDNQRIVRAVSRAELYEKAALAMFDILVDLERVRGEGKVSLEVSGEDREDLAGC